MTLSALIRKRENATATVATPATHTRRAKAGTVAKVASVAVANPRDGTSSPSLLDLFREKKQPQPAIATATVATVATHGKLGTVAKVASVAVANPTKPGQLYAEEREAIQAWLEHIGEADPDEISHVLEACQLDEQARFFCLEQAAAMPRPTAAAPQITPCGQCAHFDREPDHRHLGHCAKGEPEPLAGLWDADRRYCTQYEVGNETLGKPDRAGNKQ